MAPARTSPANRLTSRHTSLHKLPRPENHPHLPTPPRAGATNSAPVHVVPISDELRSSYRIDPFYTKTLTSVGVVIVGSDKVSDWAFLEAAYTLDHQLHDSPSWVRDALSTNKVRLAILAVVEYTMDLPENNRRKRTVAEAAFQDRRSRGLGGMPDCSCAEENLLNLRGDPYGGNGAPDSGENITIHEFSHTVASAIGRTQGRDGEFWTKLRKAFADAKAPADDSRFSTKTERTRFMRPRTSRNIGPKAPRPGSTTPSEQFRWPAGAR